MQTSDSVGNENNPIVENLSTVAASAFKELEMAKHDLKENFGWGFTDLDIKGISPFIDE